ncbi:MAG: hypothetical protein ABI333_27360 [bacterium]
MATDTPNNTGWPRALRGLGFVRRGSVLVAASGLLLLVLGTAGRAGCANPHLPEVRSLMQYQSLVFYLALLLGFLLVVGGLLGTALMPGPWQQRAIVLGCGGLATLACLVMAALANPGEIADLGSPPGGAGVLVAAVLGTTALAGSAMPVMLVSRQLGDPGLARSAAMFGIALVIAAAANAEAASGLLFPDPMHGLWVVGIVAAIDAAALLWLYALLAQSEALIEKHLHEA